MKPHRRKHRRPTRLLRDGIRSAADLIGDVGRGERVCGVTAGQFSLIDLIHHLLDLSGPADVVISTWTAGVKDAEHAKRAQRTGRVKSMIWIVDRSFISRQPMYAERLVALYGDDAIRVTRTHAKFVIIDGPERRFVVQSSMNLNQNKRMESFDITEGDDIADHYLALVDAILETAVPGLSDSKGARAVLAKVMEVEVPEEEALSLRFDTPVDLDWT